MGRSNSAGPIVNTLHPDAASWWQHINSCVDLVVVALQACLLVLVAGTAEGQDVVGCTDSPYYVFPNSVAQDSLIVSSSCGYEAANGDYQSFCAGTSPSSESQPGQSLYWQDECSDGYREEEPLFHDSRTARFYGALESVALFRDAETGVPGIGGNLVETEFEHSLRGVVGVALGGWYRLEFSWIQDFEWSDRLIADRFGNAEQLDFQSSLSTSEINLRRRVRIRDWPQHYPDYWNSFEFSTLIGFRHLELDEKYTRQFVVNPAMLSTTNTMSGVQLGGLGQWLYEDRGWIDLEAKGAILSNDLTVVDSFNSFRDEETRTAFLVDASVACNYQFSSCLTLRLGYNVLWLSGTALVGDNLASVASARHASGSVYHGPSIGLVFAR